jgi:hypothetical protein
VLSIRCLVVAGGYAPNFSLWRRNSPLASLCLKVSRAESLSTDRRELEARFHRSVVASLRLLGLGLRASELHAKPVVQSCNICIMPFFNTLQAGAKKPTVTRRSHQPSHLFGHVARPLVAVVLKSNEEATAGTGGGAAGNLSKR